MGVPCNADAQSAACDGICVELGGGEAVCSHRCEFGNFGDCSTTGATPGGCLFVTLGGTIGDIAYCAELCDCPTDCVSSAAVCDPFNDASLEAAFGHRGVCTPAPLALGTPITCP